MTFPPPYRERPARRADLEALVELSEARDLADVGFLDQSRQEILDDWAEPGFDHDRDTVVAEAPDGAVVAYGFVLAIDPSVQQFGLGRVHPEHAGRGLGSALVDAVEDRARSRLGAGVTSPFRTGIASTDRAAAELLTRRGYDHVRSFWHMQRDLPASELGSGVPAGIALRTSSPDDEPVVHRLLDESFREHFGYEPEPFEYWQAWIRAAPGYEPSLTVLAFAGDEPVGVSVNTPGDDGVGWVSDLGVLETHRGRGVARALLARSFIELAERGHHSVRLGVDAENATGATHLYETVGMTIRRRFDVFQRPLTGA